jgi:hypothetical protein
MDGRHDSDGTGELGTSHHRETMARARHPEATKS